MTTLQQNDLKKVSSTIQVKNLIIYSLVKTSQKHHCCDCIRGAGNGRHLQRVSAILSPSHRLFCSAVFLLQNVLTEPLKKSMLN